MASFLLTILILWCAWILMRRFLTPWLTRWMIRRATRFAARQAGFDPDRFSTGSRRRRQGNGRRDNRTDSRRNRRPTNHEPIIPPEYAEDVEFTEFHSYSEETVISTETPEGNRHNHSAQVKVESQVTDAEIIEITNSSSK